MGKWAADNCCLALWQIEIASSSSHGVSLSPALPLPLPRPAALLSFPPRAVNYPVQIFVNSYSKKKREKKEKEKQLQRQMNMKMRIFHSASMRMRLCVCLCVCAFLLLSLRNCLFLPYSEGISVSSLGMQVKSVGKHKSWANEEQNAAPLGDKG